MPQTEQQTFYNFKTTTQDGQTTAVEYRSEKQYEEAKAEAAKLGTALEVTKAQTFIITRAESFDDILNVVPNQTVALEYFNYGFTLAQHNVKRELMKDASWPGQEEPYDTAKDVQDEKERRVADPLATTRRALKALWAKTNAGQPVPSDDEINAMLQQMVPGASPAPAAV